MSSPTSERVRKRRDAMRSMGLRPVQIWIPDTRRPGFTEECRRQAELVATADENDPGLQCLLDAALEELGRDEE